MPVKIVKCKCNHKFQDTEYGYGNRVANTSAKGATCTVCLTTHGVSNAK